MPPKPKTQTNKLNNKYAGFTIIELAIVLVITGLLVSGVLIGSSLIKAAELRSILSDKKTIETSVNLFNQKYQGLPGDLTNATTFWGTMPAGTCNTSAVGASGGTGTQTCNGDGDGKILNNWTASANTEPMLFWQHLSNAGLIEGRYTGIWTNVPGAAGQELIGKISGTTWRSFVIDPAVAITDLSWFEGSDYGNILYLYKTLSGVDDFNVITPSEMWGIDKKIDDGFPGTGKVVTGEQNGVNCNTVAASAGAIATTATYNATYEQNACLPIFKQMW